MVHSIVRENDTWIFTYDKPSFYIILFGKLNSGVSISTKTNFTALEFDNENELETYVDNFVTSGYYKEQAETQGIKYIGESEKYPVIILSEPEDEITDPPDEP
jgi:hypothetical protein